MAKLEILIYPDARLRQVAKPVTQFDAELKKLVDDMAKTMYAAGGIGLAAVQVNVAKRVVVIDLSPEHNALQVFINPRVADLQGEVESEEGCLSVPGVVDVVSRAAKVTIYAQDVEGRHFEIQTDGEDDMLAVCIQHEIDHLDGKVFVDYLSRLKQERIGKKLRKESRLKAA